MLRQSAYTLKVIESLGGYASNGTCRCPSHEDRRPSLSVCAGDKVPILLKCFAGCSFKQITTALADMGLWPPPPSGVEPPASSVRPWRSPEERRAYALQILDDVRRNRGHELAPELRDYFAARGIEKVPPTALLALPIPYCNDLLLPTRSAMVFEVTDGQRPLGIHVTWLNAKLTGKKDDEPQRQCYGPIRGGYVKLYRGMHHPKQPLLIGEGIETTCAAAQISGLLHAISGLSAENLPHITPPPASEYIIPADNDANGKGQQAARALARRLTAAGYAVRIALPPRPDTDWNHEIMP
jgi:hypothetical protein